MKSDPLFPVVVVSFFCIDQKCSGGGTELAFDTSNVTFGKYSVFPVAVSSLKIKGIIAVGYSAGLRVVGWTK